MDLYQSLGYQINLAAKKLKQDLNKNLSKYDLSTSQWAILKIVSEHENLTQADIALALHSDRATCGTMFEKLIKKGMLTKILREEDKRCYIVSLTPKSLNIIEDLTREAEQSNKNATKNINPEELESFHQVLQAIIMNLGDD